MFRIDVDELLNARVPGIARLTPRFVRSWLRRLVHQEQINAILRDYGHLSPGEFIARSLERMDVGFTARGFDLLDPAERLLFVANHPFGGLDGLMIALALIRRFGDVRVVVNDLLMPIEPLRPLWVPVNKHGRQNSDYADRFEAAFEGDLPLLTFPAGMCSRRYGGVVTDPAWGVNFVRRAVATQRRIVPVYVDGTLSDSFYRKARLRERLGIRFNIEMLWLPDEMFRQCGGRSFGIVAGEPIDPAAMEGSLRERSDAIRRSVYDLARRFSND